MKVPPMSVGGCPKLSFSHLARIFLKHVLSLLVEVTGQIFLDRVQDEKGMPMEASPAVCQPIETVPRRNSEAYWALRDDVVAHEQARCTCFCTGAKTTGRSGLSR